MKYDRPVWQIMHACADAMPEAFRYADVRAWFAKNYPEVGEATIRAHIVGLTEGGAAKHVQFQRRSPVFRRVDRGVYSAIPLAERGEHPDEEETAPVDRPWVEALLGARPAAERSSAQTELERARLERARLAQQQDELERTAVKTMEAEQAAHEERRRARKLGRSAKKAEAEALERLEADRVRAAARAGAHIVRAPRPDVEPADDESKPDAIVIGSRGERVAVPAPAKDAYRDVQFEVARFEAEASGAPWFVVSVEHGLLEPDEWISPDADAREYEVGEVWASVVVERLSSLIGPLDGKVVHIGAPDDVVAALTGALRNARSKVSTGGASTPSVAAAPPASDPVADHLGDAAHAVPASAARSLPHEPGLYAWLVDQAGARQLSEALGADLASSVLYVGQIGASGSDGQVVGSLNDHVNLVQIGGAVRLSAFRLGLANVLASELDLVSVDDPRLTRWMLDHLSVTVWPCDDIARLADLKATAVEALSPPLNVEHPAAGVVRDRLKLLRGRAG